MPPMPYKQPFVAAQDAPKTAGRPNFVFVYTDDQRWDALSVVQREQGKAARFPWFQTPNMDRVAKEGVRFRNAFVVSSLCAPSRTAFLTGCYNHQNGVANNHTPFPTDSVTHAALLRAAGYVTGYVGKWHMGSQRERPGFDYAASFIGQGKYQDCPFVVNGTDTPTSGWVDDISTDYAIEFLKKNQSKPFSLVVGYKSSHGPWQPPARTRDSFASDVSRPVPNLGSRAAYLPAAGDPNADRSPLQRNYFRTLAAVDDNIGRLLKTLDELGLAENTVFIFSSDNGYYLGEHGLGDKRSAYDESMRIPLLVRYPKGAKAGRTEDAMALNIDLAPTLLQLAGLPVPSAMQGRSLAPFLRGESARPRDAFFYEYFYERGFTQIPTMFAVRTPTAKLIKYPGNDEWTELFDLKNDPYETKNLYSDPAATRLRQEMLATFDRTAREVNFRTPSYADKSERSPTTLGSPTPGSPSSAAAVSNREVLRLEAPMRLAGERIEDRSGLGNHAVAHAVTVVPTGKADEKRVGTLPPFAFRFDGTADIEVPNTPSLNPAGGPWIVEVVLNPEKPNGVILARGGQSQGYALFLDGGTLCWAVNVGGRPLIVRGSRLPPGEWSRVRGVISKDRRASLLVDGKEIANAALPSFLTQNPNDAMQIGADLKTSVAAYPKPDRFTGKIALVRLYRGEETKKPE